MRTGQMDDETVQVQYLSLADIPTDSLDLVLREFRSEGLEPLTFVQQNGHFMVIVNNSESGPFAYADSKNFRAQTNTPCVRSTGSTVVENGDNRRCVDSCLAASTDANIRLLDKSRSRKLTQLLQKNLQRLRERKRKTMMRDVRERIQQFTL